MGRDQRRLMVIDLSDYYIILLAIAGNKMERWQARQSERPHCLGTEGSNLLGLKKKVVKGSRLLPGAFIMLSFFIVFFIENTTLFLSSYLCFLGYVYYLSK
jgi:hypothetical protein